MSVAAIPPVKLIVNILPDTELDRPVPVLIRKSPPNDTDPAVELQTNVDAKDVVKLMTEKNIVAFFQGRSESGPRALGNRSLLFDPRFEDGKDFVNQIKRREFFLCF